MTWHVINQSVIWFAGDDNYNSSNQPCLKDETFQCLSLPHVSRIIFYSLQFRNESHHPKTGLRILAVVMSKESFTGTSPATPSFGMTPPINLICKDNWLQFYSWCHTKIRLAWAGVNYHFIHINSPLYATLVIFNIMLFASVI